MVMPALSICGVEEPWPRLKHEQMETSHIMDSSMGQMVTPSSGGNNCGFYPLLTNPSMSPSHPRGAHMPPIHSGPHNTHSMTSSHQTELHHGSPDMGHGNGRGDGIHSNHSNHADGFGRMQNAPSDDMCCQGTKEHNNGNHSDFNCNIHHGQNSSNSLLHPGNSCMPPNGHKVRKMDTGFGGPMCKDGGSDGTQDIAEATKVPASEAGKELCCGCGQPIQERYELRVVDNYFHEKCLRCAMCAQSLTSSCFVKDGQLLCKQDYSRFYGAKCSGCCQNIPANEFIMRALDQLYHLQCFACVACGYQLQKGDQFVVKDGRLFCRMDYEKEYLFRYVHHGPEGDWGYPFLHNSDPDSGDDMDGDSQKGPKRPRTILTTSQRRKFKASFEVNPKPCRKVRESLAAETGLSVRVVQVWFQNQRAKMKKIARKQQLNKESQNGGKKSSQKDDKDDSDSDCESEPSAKTPTKNLDSLADLNSGDSLSVTSGALAPPSGHGGTNNVQGLEDVFMNQASQQRGHCGGGGGSGASPGPLGGHGVMMGPGGGVPVSVVNPIDKLYSMHTSYFNTD